MGQQCCDVCDVNEDVRLPLSTKFAHKTFDIRQQEQWNPTLGKTPEQNQLPSSLSDGCLMQRLHAASRPSILIQRLAFRPAAPPLNQAHCCVVRCNLNKKPFQLLLSLFFLRSNFPIPNRETGSHKSKTVYLRRLCDVYMMCCNVEVGATGGSVCGNSLTHTFAEL